MTTSITSLNCYYGEVKPTLGKRQEQVLEALQNTQDSSNSEIGEILRWSINRVTPRVLELRTLGKIEYSQIRECKVTHRMVKTWKLKEQKPTQIKLLN